MHEIGTIWQIGALPQKPCTLLCRKCLLSSALSTKNNKETLLRGVDVKVTHSFHLICLDAPNSMYSIERASERLSLATHFCAPLQGKGGGNRGKGKGRENGGNRKKNSLTIKSTANAPFTGCGCTGSRSWHQ